MLVNWLENIGLSANQSKVYISLLETDSATVCMLSRSTNITRSSLYNILSDLLKKGFVSRFYLSGVRRYKANNPNCILSFLEGQKMQLDHYKKFLTSFVRTYAEKSHENANLDVYVTFKSSLDFPSDFKVALIPNEYKRLFRVSNHSKVIVSGCKESNTCNYKFLKEDFYICFLIYEKRVVIFNPFALEGFTIEIKCAKIALSFYLLFLKLWESI